MAIRDWPIGLYPQQMEFRLRDTGVQFRSYFSGIVQSVNFIGEHWTLNITLPGHRSDRSASDPGPALGAFLHWLKGGFNQARVHDWKYSVPRGTMRGSPTLAIATQRGDNSLFISTVVGATLLAGDKIGLGGQLLEVLEDAEAATSVIIVNTVNRVRGNIAPGAAVTWDRPTVNMVMPEMSAGVLYTPGFVQPASVQLEEAF